jgi:hypothetical protein
VLLLRVKMMKMMRMVVGMVEEVVVRAGMRMRVVGLRMVMAIMSLLHVMMFGDDDDGVATVMPEMAKRTAGLAETDVHPEMMLVTMDMTVSEIAEVRVMAMGSGITMVTAKVTVMMVASPWQQ